MEREGGGEDGGGTEWSEPLTNWKEIQTMATKTAKKKVEAPVVDLKAQLAANLMAVKAARQAERATLNDPAMIAAIAKAWPLGTRVIYNGGRVAARKGAVGTVVAYRDGNGLWIEFPDGRGSATPGKCVVAPPEPKPTKAPAKPVKKGARKAA